MYCWAYNTHRTKMHDNNSTKLMEVNTWKVLTLYMKWYNIL